MGLHDEYMRSLVLVVILGTIFRVVHRILTVGTTVDCNAVKRGLVVVVVDEQGNRIHLERKE